MTLIRQNWDPRVLLKFMGIRAFIANVKNKGVSGNTLGIDKGRTLRDSIDAYLPSFYLVDIETIVDETFRELDMFTNSKFFNTILDKKLVIKTSKPAEPKPIVTPFSSEYTSQLDDKTPANIKEISAEAFDLYREWFIDRWNNRQTLVREIHTRLTGYQGNKKSFKALIKAIEFFRDSIASRAGTSKPISDSELRTKIDAFISNKLTGTFGKIDQDEVSQIIVGYNVNKNHLYYGPSFDLVSSNIYTKIDEVFFDFFNSRPFEVELIKSQFKTGFFVAGGHSGYRQKGSPLYGVTPMTITGSLILETFGTKGSANLPAQEDLADYTRDFFTRTLHRDYIIEFNLDTNYDFGVLWELGISFARSQRFSFNSGDLSRDEKLEMSFLIKEYDDLSKKLEKEITKGIFSGGKLFDLIFRQFTRSPTLEEVTVSQAFAPLMDGKTKFGKKSSKDTIPVDEIIKLPKQTKKPRTQTTTSKTKKPVVPKTGSKFKPTRVTKPVKSIVDLPMLMMQINSSLHDQIKANMGTGNRRDVLNYRTGRFAQSAKVERISESRQGMITAFYSYMKNPYATFSRGGRQERPYTRDPKTLISKSIRELAGQQVANRMRAVLI